MSETETVISVSHVSKDFILPHQRPNTIKGMVTNLAKRGSAREVETQHALKDISFEIKRGEFFGIVGRNGSGKSTLLKILAGIYQPTEGEVRTDGKLVPFIELGVGFNAELTGRQNVFLNGAMLGFSHKEIETMYDDIVAFAELERFMDQKLKNYSSGMQVRLAFSMATRAKADILLIDEVLAVGDADFQRKCFNYFKQLKKNNKTVVFVSHDMSAVREYCDRAIMIEKSELVSSGSAEEIAKKYTHMFVEQAAATSEEPSTGASNRWGNGRAKIEKVKISPSKLISKEDVMTITVTVRASQPSHNLVVGFSIKSPDGKPLLGTNTKLEQTPTGKWLSGQVKKVSWQVPNIYPDGVFSVDFAVVESSGSVCDWFDDAASFTSYDEKNPPYSASPGIKTQVEEQ